MLNVRLFKQNISKISVVAILLLISTKITACPTSYPDMTVMVTGCENGGWGSGPYTDDSNVASIARHAGILGMCQSGVIRRTSVGMLTSYTGSASNGITTSSYGSWCGMTISVVNILSGTSSICFCATFSGAACSVCQAGHTLIPTGGTKCIPDSNIDANCIEYNGGCYTCSLCATGYFLALLNNIPHCLVDPTDRIRDCYAYSTLAGGGYQCAQCGSVPNAAIYQFITNGVLAKRCLNSLTEYLISCGTYSLISSVYKCIGCDTGYELINVTISGVQVEKCLNSATQVIQNCTAYGVNATNNYVCTACSSGSTLLLISGTLRCLLNSDMDPNCVVYIYVAPNIECGQCTALYTVSSVYTIAGVFKACLLTSILIRDCSVYEAFSGPTGYQCYQCAAVTNMAIVDSLFDAVQMGRCLNSVSQTVSDCAGYNVVNPYVCNSCNSGFTLKPISGVPKCLPNIVIDPECTTYILNGANYECSVCNATFTVSSVYTSTGTYKYCLLTSILIRDCSVYQVFSGGHQCNQCMISPNNVLIDNVFDSVQMKRCLNSVTQVVPECSAYMVGSPYYCSACNSGFTLKPISGVPKCLPDIVIDPQCTTYIQNATSSAYECSVCNSTFTVSDVFTATGTYKYCISNGKLIRDCILYQRFSRGQECKQCSSSASIALHNFLYNGMQMNRCLNDLTEYDGNCTTYRFVNNIYYCISCVANYALKMNSGGPVSDICVECKTVTFKCKTCTTIWTCTSCQYPYILGPTGLCDKCQAGFQYVDTLCVKPVGCQSFLSDYSKCLACFGKYHFVYSPSKDACICDLHYKLATVDNKTVCVNQCGDGVITPPEEECDDQNTRNDDGCDQNCRVEKDFVCSSISPSSCKLQYKASTLKHNYVYKVEEKNRCRFSFSLFPVHPVFQYLDWQKYLHLNISAYSEYVVPASVSYSYEASTQEIFVQFDYEKSLEGMTVQAKFSTTNVPVSSSMTQKKTETLKESSIKTSNPNNREFMSVKASSSNEVVLQIISVPSELTAVFNLQGINAALNYSQSTIIKAYQVGCTISLIISIIILLQFFIGSYVHKMIGLETIQILQLLFFVRVIVDQKHTDFLQSMNFLKYAAYGGYSNYVLVYHTDSPEPINLSYMTVNKKFLSAGLMKFFTLNVNLPLIFPILGVLYFAFILSKKYYKRSEYFQNRDQLKKDEYTILRRWSQSTYNHFVFPLINIFNFTAFFCTILYLQSKSLENGSSTQLQSSEQIGNIQQTSFTLLICTVFVTFFLFCYEIFESYEQYQHSRLTQKQRAKIPLSLIQKLEHDENNPDKPNYKPGYVLVYLMYYLIVQIIIFVGVFTQTNQISFSCQTVAIINFIYLVIIWRWNPYCLNVDIHNKSLRLNHSTSLVFLIICIFVKRIKFNPMVCVLLFYFVFILLVIVGICGFIRIYAEYRFRCKMQEDTTILEFDDEKLNHKNKNKDLILTQKLKLKQKQYEKNPFLFENQIRQYRQKCNLPQLEISQMEENQVALIKKQMFDQICMNQKSKPTLLNYFDKQTKQKLNHIDPLKIEQVQMKKSQRLDDKLIWKELMFENREKSKKQQHQNKRMKQTLTSI